jgi:hypothetical protein
MTSRPQIDENQPDKRPEPSTTADERTLLTGFLDYQRQTLLLKCAGLTPEQLITRATPPSTLSLLGLVRHLTKVEAGWLQERFDGGDDAETVYGPAAELDAITARPHRRTGEHFSLRWILIHLIEEYARHNGHADLLREAIDGVVGE